MMKQYSNPRTKLIVDDWPLGGSRRGTCIFKIEQNSRGQRCTRETEKANGQWSKPKLGTYAECVRIVDGDDGRTYIASYGHGSIYVMRGDLKYSEESIYPDDPRYADLVAAMKAVEVDA